VKRHMVFRSMFVRTRTGDQISYFARFSDDATRQRVLAVGEDACIGLAHMAEEAPQRISRGQDVPEHGEPGRFAIGFVSAER